MAKNFAVVMVNYNTARLTIQSLESFYRTHRGENFSVILVDNNSEANEKKVLQEYFTHHHFPNLEIIWSEKNLGFGGGNNLGAQKSTSEHLLFLNSDVVMTENVLGALSDAFLADENLQIAAPILKLENGEVQQYLAGDFATLSNLIFGRKKDGREKLKVAKSPALIFTDWVSGCALAIRRAQFEKLGGFDTAYFMYFEDQDLAKKNALAGGKTALVTDVSLIHLGGQSVAKTRARKNFYFASQDIFWQKYYSPVSGLILKFLRTPYRWLNKN